MKKSGYKKTVLRRGLSWLLAGIMICFPTGSWTDQTVHAEELTVEMAADGAADAVGEQQSGVIVDTSQECIFIYPDGYWYGSSGESIPYTGTYIVKGNMEEEIYLENPKDELENSIPVTYHLLLKDAVIKPGAGYAYNTRIRLADNVTLELETEGQNVIDFGGRYGIETEDWPVNMPSLKIRMKEGSGLAFTETFSLEHKKAIDPRIRVSLENEICGEEAIDWSGSEIRLQTHSRNYTDMSDGKHHHITCENCETYDLQGTHDWQLSASEGQDKVYSCTLCGALAVPGTEVADGLTIQAEQTTVKSGEQICFSAEVTGESGIFQGVDWSVEGALSPNTRIQGGILYVGRDEPAGTLKVKACSLADPSISAETEVTVEGDYFLLLEHPQNMNIPVRSTDRVLSVKVWSHYPSELSYQWMEKTDEGDVSIEGAETSDFQIPSDLKNGSTHYYYCKITGGDETEISETAEVCVMPCFHREVDSQTYECQSCGEFMQIKIDAGDEEWYYASMQDAQEQFFWGVSFMKWSRKKYI